MNTLIICYGNDLMGNDAFGRAVYEALPDSVEKIFAVQLLPELLEKIKDYERLIFVDAAHGNGGVELYEIRPSDDDTADFHHLSAETFLRLFETLYSKTPKAYMCAGYFESFEVETRDCDFGEKVREAVKLITLLQVRLK
ncbi:MAG TPA: hydrogenase maturation protease [Campylobacterales bacterium]|nr:hydrogenase maturation protease [Campylobacterales bacterium]